MHIFTNENNRIYDNNSSDLVEIDICENISK